METNSLSRWNRIKNSHGEGTSEYIVVVVAIGIALLAGLKFVDTSVKCKFDLAFRQIFVGYQVPAQCLDLILPREDVENIPGDYDRQPFDDLFQPPPPPTPPIPPSPPPPAVPPSPIAPGTDPIRHHVGDGNCAANLCGGGLANEGTRYDKVFTVDTQAVANAGIGAVKIAFLVSGVNTTTNTVSLNGQLLGNIVNGYNEFIVPTSQLLGTNTLSIISPLAPFQGNYDHDDFEFWDISVTWAQG